MDEDWAVDIALRLSAHEFVLEVMLADRMLRMDPADAERFVEDIASPMRTAYDRTVERGAAERQAATERIATLVESLGRKALDRAARIRQARAGGK